ncbi:hypothetical protein KJ819_00635 [Patescibacteria group bacterium]|nr:hypothetical protein [Patescibacteria group bacterium]MBU1501142.1 hypothetical protein [Patescibacteria group bacterium]MBU2080985.1 hypothetical protein [Patescibacteria group bacterium]MBU2124077.1 hypothetical protein [Patescibacteria group bacterium]MBU2194932.1 hypothetical protein [Patescibacteria group bacterium]
MQNADKAFSHWLDTTGLEIRRRCMGAKRLARIPAGSRDIWVNAASLNGESVSRYFPPLSKREEKREEKKFREKLSRSRTIPQKEVAERNKWVESWKALSPRHKEKHRAFYADLALIGAAPQTPPEVVPAEEQSAAPEPIFFTAENLQVNFQFIR